MHERRRVNTRRPAVSLWASRNALRISLHDYQANREPFSQDSEDLLLVGIGEALERIDEAYQAGYLAGFAARDGWKAN